LEKYVKKLMQMLSTLVVFYGAACVVSTAAFAEDKKTGTAIEGMSDQEFISRFRTFWYQQATKNGMMKNNYLGVLTWQNPMDVWITQEIMYEVKPDVVVEAGTFRGGSAALWATFLAQVNPDGRVITIDIKDKRTEHAKNLPIVKEHVTFLLGSSSGAEVVKQVKAAVKGKRALFILDSAHTYEHVLSELRAYADMVPVGSYIIVQDTLGTGALRAIIEFLEENDNYETDKDRERLLISNNVGGYLKRIK
jgi:cephalosporin hydroxylase